MAPMWKKLTKNMELGEPTTFLDHVYLYAFNVNASLNEMIIKEHREMFTKVCYSN